MQKDSVSAFVKWCIADFKTFTKSRFERANI